MTVFFNFQALYIIYCTFIFPQFMYAQAKPEEDSALKRMLGIDKKLDVFNVDNLQLTSAI